jgi:hypothetical protein
MTIHTPATERRQRLPNRRHALTFDFEHAGLKYTATVGRFADGRVAEIFVQNHKSNSSVDVSARDGAILASFALQFGADLEVIRRALCRDPRGNANGVIGAVLDIIAGSAS